MKKVIAIAMSGVVLFSSSVYATRPSGSQPQPNIAAGLRDIVYNSGFVIGLYETGHGTFKLYHMWFSPGMATTDRTSNTSCTYIQKPVEIFVETGRTISCSATPYTGMHGDLQGIYKCNNALDVFVDQNGRELHRTVIHGSVCKRVVTKEYYETTISYKNTNLSQGIGANGEPYFEGLKPESARDLMVAYMRANNIPYGIFALHDVDVEQRRRRGFFRNKITIRYWEKPKFYAIIKDAGVGQHVGYGYYLIEEGRFNDFIKNRTYLAEVSKSGWSFFGNLFIFTAIAAIAAFAAPAILGAWSVGNYFMINVFLATFGFQIGMYAIKIGSTGATTTGPWNALFAPDNYKKIDGVNNPGTNALRDRLRNGNEDTSPLSGYREAWHIRKSQENSTRSPAYFYNY